jgi:pimeloyl-ACP methyl ester carboxylesterase
MLSPEATFIDAGGHRLHYRSLGTGRDRPPLMFLHEGLGSVELWRDFPDDLIEATGRTGLVYSRYGNGWSDPLEEARLPAYMHDEALDVLPEVVDQFVERPPILVGHSDGASIALIYAGSGHPVEALVLIAPHVFTEPGGLASIAAINDRFPDSDLPEKMGKYHADPEATFRGWADIWLSPAFEDWNIEEYLPGVACPVLLIQGDEDEYGTTKQLDAIEAAVAAPVERLMVPGAGHSPHLADPDLVTATSARFIAELSS